MSERDGNQTTPGTGIDFDALELEIDKEIDSLFIPAGFKPTGKAADANGNQESTLSESGDTGEIDDTLTLESLKIEDDDDEIDALSALSEPSIEFPGTSGGANGNLIASEPHEEPAKNSGGLFDFDLFAPALDSELDSILMPAPDKQVSLSLTEQTATAEEDLDIPEPSSESFADAPRGSTGKNFDLGLIAPDIDSELDSILMPSSGNDSSISDTFDTAVSFNEKSPAEKPSDGSLGDFESLQIEIDKEIDSLFTPLTKKTEETEPASQPPEQMDGLFMESPDPQPDLFTAEPVLEPEPVMQVEPIRPVEPVSVAPLVLENDVNPSRTHLPKLVEAFNAAYLSLDWEYSPENITKLQKSLKELEPFTSRANRTGSIFNMMNVILSRLEAKPQSANTRIIELTRDAQSLLAHMLLLKGEPGAGEKVRLNDLIDRFRHLRERARAAKTEEMAPVQATAPTTAAPEPVIAESAAPVQTASQAAHIPTEKPHETAAQGIASLEELGAWMTSASQTLADTLAGVNSQLERIRQLEATLSKTPVLSPVVERLGDIRCRLESFAAPLQGQIGQLSEKAAWVEKFEPAPTFPDKPVEAETAPVPEPEPAKAEEKPTPQKTGDDLCVFICAGKPFALPAKSIVKMLPLSKKKRLAIQKRGDASLADFKPMFRGLKSGVIGEWKAAAAKELKSYKFEVCSQAFWASDTIPDKVVAILASNGERHEIIFAENISFISGEITNQPPFGRGIKIESGAFAPVLDPGRLVSDRK